MTVIAFALVFLCFKSGLPEVNAQTNAVQRVYIVGSDANNPIFVWPSKGVLPVGIYGTKLDDNTQRWSYPPLPVNVIPSQK